MPTCSPVDDHVYVGDVPRTCRVCSGSPSVVLEVANPTLRRLIVELLERDCVCWQVRSVGDPTDFAAAIATEVPDLVILDTRDATRCCRDSPHHARCQRVIVIGPEPDAAYERAAQRAGASAWLPRDRLGDDLTDCMCRVLGCTDLPAEAEDCSTLPELHVENRITRRGPTHRSASA